ncbi:hypothetical protein EJ04DRAFT_538290 [Polyplosphaeria fusca]|uniref:G domain-containing protein n=1 Tax=Polyplosphaeria fusca TaxID=682080 RepID=A0A9P4QLF3_9PLEO|nr:hypothetical protein EJ04DRAFT_538290 [Polyplosphaeria fusca]
MTIDPPSRGLGGTANGTVPILEPPQLGPDDLVIAVMGVTGCGKTTFVNHFSDYPLMIGHGLDSCTQIVQVVPCTLASGSKIYLVDTPGFDDQLRSDSEILRELALWLNSAHKLKIKLTGIVYLHRILDVRIGGTGARNIRMFKKLCGQESLGSVVLATTMWDFLPDPTKGHEREAELKREKLLWKPMIDLGSEMMRQDNGRLSAMKIIEYLMNRSKPVVLEIQREMVDQKMQLGQTAAGAEVTSEAEKAKQYYDKKIAELEDQLKDALLKQDHDRKEELEDAKLEWQERLQRGEENLKDVQSKLRADSDQLYEEMKNRYEKEMEAMTKMMQEKEQAVFEAQTQVNQMKETHGQELKIQELQLKMKWKEQYYKMLYGPTKCIVM